MTYLVQRYYAAIEEKLRFSKAAFRWGRAIVIMIGAVTCACGAAAGDMGANKFDLLMQYTGRASGGDGSPAYLRVTRAMGRKAILDGADAGFTFFRVSAPGFLSTAATDKRKNDLALWFTDPQSYWRLVDAMFDDLDRAGIRLVPTFVWNAAHFPAVANESIGTLIRNPHSKSRALLEQYVGAFIDRYKDRKTILFYELSNELNLQADLDLHRRCLEHAHDPARCSIEDGFTTGDMIAFSRQMVLFIKQHDPSRRVSSGYSLPRPSADHLERQPEFSVQGPDWTPDSLAEFKDNLTRTQSPFDIVSVHVYQNATNARFGRPQDQVYRIIDDVGSVAHANHQSAFVGEFSGDNGFVSHVSEALKDAVIDYASVWIWEFYQFDTRHSFSTPASASSLEPGSTDAAIAGLQISPAVGRVQSQRPDAMSPRVVLTWPLPCSRIDKKVELFAVASGEAGDPVDHVDFYAGPNILGTSHSPPYRFSFDPVGLGDTPVVLEADAVTKGGRSSIFRTNVSLNQSADQCVVSDD